jgi:hypothetical protein
MDKSETKRIYLKKSENAASIIQKILNVRELKVTLVIPRDSILGESGNNFYLIFREASAMGKQVNVESSDEDVVNLALASGFQVINPIFKRTKRAVADIIPISAPVRRDRSRGSRIKSDFKEEEIGKPKEDLEAFSWPEQKVFKESEPVSPVINEYELKPEPVSRTPVIKLKWIVFATAFISIAGFGFYAGTVLLPMADVRLTLAKTPWETSIAITASVKANMETGFIIPGQIFTIDKNNIFSSPASGTKKVEQSAAGKITIYNAYSSSKQSIMKGTRFITTGGKIFRTTKALTIPGAEISEGKIIPSFLEADVMADEPGAEYNLAANQSWRIPGFEGTPKFNGFYGESKEPMTGGFVGDVKVPTAADIAALKDKARQELLATVRTAADIAVPNELKTINGATSYNIIKEEVVDGVDENGEFKLLLAAETKVMAFDEKSVIKVAEEKLKTNTPGQEFELKNYEISYGEASVNFETGKAVIPLTINSQWVKVFDIEKFKADIVVKSEADFNDYISMNTEIQATTVSFWPFWVRSVPKNTERIKLTLE